MNKTNIKGYRRMLEAKRAELLSSHHDTEGIAFRESRIRWRRRVWRFSGTWQWMRLTARQPSFAR